MPRTCETTASTRCRFNQRAVRLAEVVPRSGRRQGGISAVPGWSR